MKITTTQKDLNFSLDIVSKVIIPSTTLPVLNNILLKASGKNLFLSATNLETAINYSIPVDVQNEGSITIPAKLIANYINLLDEEKIELKLEEGNTLSVKSKNSQTKIKGISANEFPIIPKTEKEFSFTIPAKILAECIDHTVFSAAITPTRPVLCGVLMTLDKDMLKMAATDSYRLAEKIVKLEKKTEKPFECIVPVKTLLELGRILAMKNTTEPVEVQVSKNQILFLVGGLELTSRLIEGKFPDYEKIIPKTTRTRIEVDVDKLSLATKRVSLFAKENNNSVKITATNDGKLQIYTDETRVGEERAELDIKISGENNKISLNAQFLLDVLNNLKNTATIEMNEKLTPVVVRPLKKEDYLYVIMPLKV